MVNILNFLGSLLGYILLYLCDVFGNYGVSIIILTIFLRFIVFPSSIKQHKNSLKQSKLSKKEAEIRKIYAKDKMKCQEEIYKLKEKEGVSMTGGCVTSLVPLVFLSGFYWLITQPLTNMFHFSAEKIAAAKDLIEGGTSNFAEINVLKAFKDTPELFTTIFSGDEVAKVETFLGSLRLAGLNMFDVPQGATFMSFLWVIPFLCLITNVLQVVLSMRTQAMQNQMGGKGCMIGMMVLMPVLIAFWAYRSPLALGVYWTIGNVTACIQTIILNKKYSETKLSAMQEASRIALREQQEILIKQ